MAANKKKSQPVLIDGRTWGISKGYISAYAGHSGSSPGSVHWHTPIVKPLEMATRSCRRWHQHIIFILYLHSRGRYLVLPSNIPNSEADVLILYSLHIKTCSSYASSLSGVGGEQMATVL